MHRVCVLFRTLRKERGKLLNQISSIITSMVIQSNLFSIPFISSFVVVYVLACVSHTSYSLPLCPPFLPFSPILSSYYYILQLTTRTYQHTHCNTHQNSVRVPSPHHFTPLSPPPSLPPPSQRAYEEAEKGYAHLSSSPPPHSPLPPSLPPAAVAAAAAGAGCLPSRAWAKERAIRLMNTGVVCVVE